MKETNSGRDFRSGAVMVFGTYSLTELTHRFVFFFLVRIPSCHFLPSTLDFCGPCRVVLKYHNTGLKSLFHEQNFSWENDWHCDRNNPQSWLHLLPERA